MGSGDDNSSVIDIVIGNKFIKLNLKLIKTLCYSPLIT